MKQTQQMLLNFFYLLKFRNGQVGDVEEYCGQAGNVEHLQVITAKVAYSHVM